MTTMMKLCCYILDFRVRLRSTNISVINTIDFQSLPPPDDSARGSPAPCGRGLQPGKDERVNTIQGDHTIRIAQGRLPYRGTRPPVYQYWPGLAGPPCPPPPAPPSSQNWWFSDWPKYANKAQVFTFLSNIVQRLSYLLDCR